MKRLISASLLALLACSATAQADILVQCNVGGLCRNDVGVKYKDVQIHGMTDTGAKYQCTFDNLDTSLPLNIVKSRNNYPNPYWEQMKNIKFSKGNPATVGNLPGVNSGVVITFSHWPNKTDEKIATNFTILCVKQTA